MKIKTTDRLFYRSFPYKAVIDNEWGFAANHFTPKDIPKIKKGDLSDWGAYNRAAMKYPNEVIHLIRIFNKYNRTELRRRSEGRGLSLFFKDKNILTELQNIKTDNSVVVEFWEPQSPEALTFLESNRRVEVKKQLTHGCRYRVALQGSINKISEDGRKNFVNLVKRNKNEFYMSDRLLDDFKRNHRHFWGNYFYVKDGKFLLMAQMILQPVVKEVVKIVTHDEIQQEENANV